MTEAVDNFVPIPDIPQIVKDRLSTGEMLWDDGETRIYYPSGPLVPGSEGIHLRVESRGVPIHPKTREEWGGWFRHHGIMIGASEVVSQGGDLPDLWQSLIGQSEYTPTGHLVSDIIGRSPYGKSWKPEGLETAPMPSVPFDFSKDRIDPKTIFHFGRVLNRFFRSSWLGQMENAHVFPKALRSIHQEVKSSNLFLIGIPVCPGRI